MLITRDKRIFCVCVCVCVCVPPLKLFTVNLVTTALFLSGASVIGSPLHFPFSQALMLAKISMSSSLGGFSFYVSD